MSEVRLTIVTIPPAALCGRLTGIRSLAAALTGSRAALLHPPHVTLRTGALVPEKSIKGFALELREAIGAWRPFVLRAQGLVHTTYADEEGRQRELVAWRILPDPPLMSMHARLLTCTRWQRRPQPPFEPHLTLAYEDLTVDAAQALLQAAQADPPLYPPELSWSCSNVTLCRFDGNYWEPCEMIQTLEEYV